MRYLLDTHILLWLLVDDRQVSAPVQERLRYADELFVSAASIWEAKIKASLGKLQLPEVFLASIARSGFTELVVTGEHIAAILEIDLPHRDPFDRLLLTQAQQEGLTLVTADATLIAAYPKLCLGAI